MGGGCGKQQQTVVAEEPETVPKFSPFENRLVKRLEDLCHIEMDADHISFNRIILQFPHVETAFKTVRHTFKVFDSSHEEKISFDAMKAALSNAGCKAPENDMRDLFTESDLGQDGFLDFREFLVCI